MKNPEIIMMSLTDIKPYEKNPRKNDKAVEPVANSIREFGFRIPIVIDKDNIIVCGHTRCKAAQKLGIKEVPCIKADDLTPEQIKAFRLADNKVAELAEWDFSFLDEELNAIENIDMFKFGFEDLDFDAEERHENYQESTQNLVANILNLEKAQYTGAGKYDIPELLPVYDMPNVKEWIGFNCVLSDKNPEGKGVHFFVDDYQFERIWNNPDAYIDKLSQYACVIAPDFSPYGDMPLATQIFNHYRKHWVGRYLQEHGIIVIPCIRASTDPRSFEWYLDGEPEGGIVAISSMWTKTDEQKEVFKKAYEPMKETLKPAKILVYGKKIDIMEQDDIQIIPTFTDKRWEAKKNG